MYNKVSTALINKNRCGVSIWNNVQTNASVKLETIVKRLQIRLVGLSTPLLLKKILNIKIQYRFLIAQKLSDGLWKDCFHIFLLL